MMDKELVELAEMEVNELLIKEIERLRKALHDIANFQRDGSLWDGRNMQVIAMRALDLK